jgi:hypothetical protein
MCSLNGALGKNKVRTVRVCTSPGNGIPAVVEITQNGVMTDYAVSRMPSNFGLAFRWAHLDEVPVTDGIGREQTYDVLLEEDGYTCTCAGFLRWGKCRHSDATVKLVELGKL